MILSFSGSASAAPNYYQIRSNMEKMTEVQFSSYTKGLIGQKVTWTGYVSEVSEGWFGGYKVLIDMDPPTSLSVQDITIEIPESIAMKFTKNKKVTFTGVIESIIEVLSTCQVSLKNVKFQGI